VLRHDVDAGTCCASDKEVLRRGERRTIKKMRMNANN